MNLLTLTFQIIGALTASLVNASVGILGGYAAIALPELNLDKIQASWFASMDLFLCMIFAPIGGLLSGWLGRKKIMLAFSPLAVIGWVLIATQTSEWMLFSGRFLSSIAIASMMASSSMLPNNFAKPFWTSSIFQMCTLLKLFIQTSEPVWPVFQDLQ